MKHGDISNKLRPKIAIRLDGFLIKKESLKTTLLSTLIENVKNRFNIKKRYLFNISVVNALMYIYKNTDLTVDLVVCNKDIDIDKLDKDIYFEIPYDRIIQIDSVKELPSKIWMEDYMYYIDETIPQIKGISGTRHIDLSQLFLTIVKH